MKCVHVVLAVIVLLFLVACTSQANKTAEGSNRSKQVSASGYTKEGCLLNLKLTAREQSVRLVPDTVEVEGNSLMFLFPFFNHEGYRCSGNFVELRKQPLVKDSLYPIN
ncbi:MAG: hypothetical protein QM706_07230 [Nitrospira sp.]